MDKNRPLLREIFSDANQRLGRRWFRSDELDLRTWSKEKRLIAFELSDSNWPPVALHWSDDKGLQCFNVDEGENRTGRYKASPLLTPSDISADRYQRIQEKLSEQASIIDGNLMEDIETILGRGR